MNMWFVFLICVYNHTQMLTSFVNKVKEAVWTVKSGGSNWHLEIDLLRFVSQNHTFTSKTPEGRSATFRDQFFFFHFSPRLLQNFL